MRCCSEAYACPIPDALRTVSNDSLNSRVSPFQRRPRSYFGHLARLWLARMAGKAGWNELGVDQGCLVPDAFHHFCQRGAKQTVSHAPCSFSDDKLVCTYCTTKYVRTQTSILSRHQMSISDGAPDPWDPFRGVRSHWSATGEGSTLATTILSSVGTWPPRQQMPATSRASSQRVPYSPTRRLADSP